MCPIHSIYPINGIKPIHGIYPILGLYSVNGIDLMRVIFPIDSIYRPSSDKPPFP